MVVSLANTIGKEHSSKIMRVAITILVIVCLGLGWALVARHTKAVERARLDDALIIRFSNDWQQASLKLDDAEKFNMYLQTNLEARVQELSIYSNNFVKVSADFARLQSDAKAAAAASALEIQKREERITKLETERDGLVAQLNALNSSIERLTQQIAQTEQQLATAEGDREFLITELKRLQSEKSELERQFSNVSLLKEQVSKMQEELTVARRIEWDRTGVYARSQQKGAAALMESLKPKPAAPAGFDLNVELSQDGTIKVVPTTNAAPAAVGSPGSGSP